MKSDIKIVSVQTGCAERAQCPVTAGIATITGSVASYITDPSWI